ncbi:tyrosine-type recombinase/integrase [Undibacterium sp. MH2W]|uniref:tyrosine-type recombinase/integrase n=1 Tax=Undibacterium sp. MH2W TaxID=3413044 RepID=UPI003BF03A17
MAIEKLSDTTLRAIKAGATEYKGKQRLDDGGGLVLLLAVKGGGRAWRFNYTFAGKRKSISLGKYPDTTLATAREKAKAAREEISAKRDPSALRKEDIAKQKEQIAIEKREDSGLPTVDSFAHIAMEWFEGMKPAWSESHSSRTLAYLEKDLIPWIGRKPIADIEAPDLLECLRRVHQRGATEAANRLRAVNGQIWRYAIANGKAKRDIAADLIGALPKHVGKNFSHITDPKQLGQLLRDIDNYAGTPMVKVALSLLPLVFTRPAEFRCAKWRDIDLETREWRYIATKTKTDHIVPLSNQVATKLQGLQALTGHGEYVFGVRAGERPLSENTINAALKTLGYSSDIIQPHGFRHTAATMLAEMGWNTDAIDRQLAHKEQGVKGVYQKAQYLDERRKMMQAWADYADGLKSGAQVIPFRAA